MHLSQVLNKLMSEHDNLSAYKLSKETGISDRLIGYWKNGDKLPSAENIVVLATYFGITTDYLLGLTDEPTQKVPQDTIEHQPAIKSAVDLMNNIENNANNMNIKGLQRLSDYSDDLIVNPAYISKHPEADNLIEFVDAADAARLSSKHNLIIPFFENAVSAGVGEEFITDAEQFIRIPQTYKKLHADYAVRISGNSMEPDYKNDDILLVRYQQQLEPGELGIFIVDNKMYFKKLGDGRLISLNPEYEDLIISSVFNPRIQGKVISKLEA